MDPKEKRRQIAEKFIFSWLPERNTFRTLVAFGFFSAVAHFLCFYLFQVVYPEPVRSELRPKPIVLLDPSAPEIRSFIDQCYDRIVFLEPASSPSLRSPLNVIRFSPSFGAVKPSLLPFPGEKPFRDFPYPPPPASPGKAALIFSQNLTARGLAPHNLFADYLTLFPAFPGDRVFLTVSPDGFPVEVTVSGNGADQEKKAFAKIIQQTLRFNPGPEGRGDDPGWMELEASARR